MTKKKFEKMNFEKSWKCNEYIAKNEALNKYYLILNCYVKKLNFKSITFEMYWNTGYYEYNDHN